MGGESDEPDHHQRFSPFVQVHCTDDGERGQDLESQNPVLDAGEGLLEHLVASEDDTEESHPGRKRIRDIVDLLYGDDAADERDGHRRAQQSNLIGPEPSALGGHQLQFRPQYLAHPQLGDLPEAGIVEPESLHLDLAVIQTDVEYSWDIHESGSQCPAINAYPRSDLPRGLPHHGQPLDVGAVAEVLQYRGGSGYLSLADVQIDSHSAVGG